MTVLKHFGGGPLSRACTIKALLEGYLVIIQSILFPGGGGTGDLAAGIGCKFMNNSLIIKKQVNLSYPIWMQRAQDPNILSTWLTQLHCKPTGAEGDIQLVGFGDSTLYPGFVVYTTFAFNPVRRGKEQMAEIERLKGQIIQGAISPQDWSCIKNDQPVSGADHTLVAIGYGEKIVDPATPITSALGMLVHFPPEFALYVNNGMPLSIMNDEIPYYLVIRPAEEGVPDARPSVVLGGSFDEGKTQYTQSEEEAKVNCIIHGCVEAFGLDSKKFCRDNVIRVTACKRPKSKLENSEPIIVNANNHIRINGYSGQGWCASDEVANEYIRMLKAKGIHP